MKNKQRLLGATMAAAILSTDATGQPTTLSDARSDRDDYSPYLNDTYPDKVLYGDTHVHTSYSADAGLFGNTIGPDVAYRFAKGEEVTSSTGTRARLLRPLDFLVVADHAENLGLAPMIAESHPLLLASPWGRKIHDTVKGGDLGAAYTMWGSKLAAREDPFNGDTAMTTPMWERIIDAAERHNDPGYFTAFIGFEWTSTPGGSH